MFLWPTASSSIPLLQGAGSRGRGARRDLPDIFRPNEAKRRKKALHIFRNCSIPFIHLLSLYYCLLFMVCITTEICIFVAYKYIDLATMAVVVRETPLSHEEPGRHCSERQPRARSQTFAALVFATRNLVQGSQRTDL